MSSTKRAAVNPFGSLFGGSGAQLSLNGPATVVPDGPEERVEPLSPAATGVRLRRAPSPLSPPARCLTGEVAETAKLVASPPAQRRVTWVSFLLVFAGAAAATFAIIYASTLRSGSGMTTPGFLRAFLPSAGLGLRVEVQGDRLLINWDRRSPLIRSALDGVLRIEDGEQRRALYLDSSQVAAGSILYKPASGDVTFRLEVQSEQGARMVESVRVLDSLKPPLTKPGEPPARNEQAP